MELQIKTLFFRLHPFKIKSLAVIGSFYYSRFTTMGTVMLPLLQFNWPSFVVLKLLKKIDSWFFTWPESNGESKRVSFIRSFLL